MGREKFPHKILWLASYPKSGNTWFRAFLSALMNGGDVEINSLKINRIFSSRDVFDFESDLDSRDLYDNEAKLMIADIYRHIALEKNVLSIIKVHDAFECDESGNNIIPQDVTHCAIYFIRNPLDIAGSLANHMHIDIQAAINIINDQNASMAKQVGNLNRNAQLRQYTSDWSSHVKSWTLKPSFPVHVIRYEDMLTDTFDTFNRVLKLIGWEYTPEQVKRAIASTSFDTLSRQEAEKGFIEKDRQSPVFFRSGTIGNWEKELTTDQVNKIIFKNNIIMNSYGYI
jgi:hypothetical protein